VSIKLKNANVLPLAGFETITVLGLEIPLRDRLAFGAQVEVIDLQNKYMAGDIGEFEYLMRLFCVFTRALPKTQQVRFEWLAQQQLEADEVAELTSGTLRLLNAIRRDDDSEVEAGKNADKGTKAKKAKTKPASTP